MKAVAAFGGVALALSFSGCGGTSCNQGGYAEVTPLPAMVVTCVPLGGQPARSPYFVGQNLMCSASSDGKPVPVIWSTTAGVISTTGELTGVNETGAVTVTATWGAAGSPSQSTQIQFAKPEGAPGLIFAVQTAVGSIVWDIVVDADNSIYGAGWTPGAVNPKAELVSMDFWSRKPNRLTLPQSSMLTAAVMEGAHSLFGGGSITSTGYSPLVVSSDSKPTLLDSEGCTGAGMITALAVDRESGKAWGAWSGDTQASLIELDGATLQAACASAQPIVTSTAAQNRVPWVWSLHAFNGGFVASGHYLADANTVGFVAMLDAAGAQVTRKEYPNLADLRTTPPITEDGKTVFYVAGHDVTGGADVWTLKKLDANLEETWTRTWTTAASGNNEPYAVIENPAGGVFLGGMATQLNATNPKQTDAVLLALDRNGNTTWGPVRSNLSASGMDACYVSSLKLTRDSKFLIAASGCTGEQVNSYLLGFALP